jgi:acyl-CoA synthetase (NDP forming)
LVGPNTMGIYSGPLHLHALMPPVRPVPGKIAFAAQSGNLGTQVLSLGGALGVGFSRFVCIGNEADLKVADYLQYFADDPASEVILLYIEGLRDAHHFLQVARKTSPNKPIVVMKAGKTDAGAKAAVSHSAALAADADIFDGVIRQTGMIEADTTEEMLDIAKAFAAMPPPRGKRVGVITWGGGWGVITADALARHGLELVQFPEEVLKQLDAILPPYWSRGNPVDLVGTLDLSTHFKSLRIIAGCDCVDSIITLGTMGATSSFQSFAMEGQALEDTQGNQLKPKVIPNDFLEQLQKIDESYRNEVIRLVRETQKPIIAVSFPTSGALSPMLARQSEVVIYPSPERGAKTLAALYEYQEFLQRKPAGV